MAKTIITLGLPSSGKSCYLSAAVGYMFRHRMYNIVGLNRNLQELTDEIEERMQSGQWVDKTTGRMEYQFTKKGVFDTEYILHDWNGEYFQLLGLDGEQAKNGWTKAQENIDGRKVAGNALCELYEKDCKEADAILLFIDGKTLMDSEDKKTTRQSLYTLVSFLRESQKKQVISVVLTKSDYLEGNKEFCGTDKMIDMKRIVKNMRSKYNSFLSEVISAGNKISVSVVSCVPVKEHRSNSSGGGTVPNEKWSLEDLKKTNASGGDDDRYNDMLTPIKWVINNL